jgi:hypothetical protein
MLLRDVTIERLHRIREAFGREHGYDARRIARALRDEERANGRKVVTSPARRPTRSKRSS